MMNVVVIPALGVVAAVLYGYGSAVVAAVWRCNAGRCMCRYFYTHI